ncbi:HupE/UreJ family protein [Solimonas terrae]|uniref:HupE/UreJ family protein n=1 Tax=Solimonas terrae TaxID=1396819 RepID=A0A6M2BKP6_9GAMM|nr:HupE/UreJ family protein [Solimonas terrae]NGY03144.1 HupE/UreJ family protein [Solimonas terrae]
MRRLTSLAALILLTTALPALAHPGHDGASAGFVAGFLHPLLGLDHLLAMTVVGVWAAQLGGRATWLVPCSFVALMAIGGLAATQGYVPPHVEAGIAASLLVLGLLVALRRRLPMPAAMGLVALFALFHGAAHGQELPSLANPGLYAIGFVTTTASLHVAGIALGRVSQRGAGTLARVAGALTAAAGLAFAFA